MATSPDRIRRGLTLITSALQADIKTVVSRTRSPAQVRAALFAATPLLVGEYSDGSAALALEWYEELREAANPAHSFTPTPLTLVTDDDVRAMVAATTETLREIDELAEDLLAEIIQTAADEVAAGAQKQAAAGFWDTVTGNVAEDPDAVGWQRFARDGACKFCLMLEGRGAVYRESTVNFAAHTSCHCVARPSFDPDAPEVGVMQYLGSKRQRTEKERAALRKYLNHNFPDAPG